MKRREFLVMSAAFAGASTLPGIAAAATKPCPPGQVGLEGGNSVATVCASSDPLADWNARISDPGVLWVQRFQSQADIDDFPGGSPGTSEPYSIFVPNAGIIPGDGAYRQDNPAGALPGSGIRWGRPMQPMPGDINNPGVTVGPWAKNATGNQQAWNGQLATPLPIMNSAYDGVAHGTPSRTIAALGHELYAQARVKFSTNRFASGTTGGKCIMFENHSQNFEQELVLKACDDLVPLKGAPYLYTNKGSAFNSALGSPQQDAGPGGSMQIEPNSAYSCSYNDPSGCWKWPVDTWMTVLIHFKPGLKAIDTANVQSVANNPAKNTTLEFWIALPGQTSYTLIHQSTNYVWNYNNSDVDNNGSYYGYGVDWFTLNFFTGGSASQPQSVGWYHQFDQLIFSLNPIACPQA